MFATGVCVDLTTRRSDGEYWDLSRKEDVKELEKLQAEENPLLMIGSPPCTTFCPLLRLRYTAEEIKERRRREGEPHIRVCMDAYTRQLEANQHFLHEHPANSPSWDMPEVKKLMNDPRVYVVQGPMCRWGMRGKDREGPGFVRKETRWMTSSRELAETFEGNMHQLHQRLLAQTCGADRW